MKKYIYESYMNTFEILKEFIDNSDNIKTTTLISEEIARVFANGGKVLICGNGGSACDAMHFAEEFTGRYRKDRKALPAISLSDPAYITCVGNDYGFDEIFKRGVEAYGKPGDIMIGLSTSGNSKNVLKALEYAKENKLLTLSLLGKDGGEIKGKCDYEFIIPGKTSDRIQEIHMVILHIIIEGVERILFPELYHQ